MGIKKKVVLGFISIGTLLFFSGVISSGELLRLNRSTYQVLQRSINSIEISKRMLDAVQEQNTALLLCVTDTTQLYDSLLVMGADAFSRALIEAQITITNSPSLARVAEANTYYNSIVAQRGDTVTLEWFSQIYKTPYYNLTHSIKEFMLSTQNAIVDYTKLIEDNAYRASMVGIIALASGILLIIIFYFMINQFLVAPISSIHKGLQRYLALRIPFDPKVDTKDEIMQLSDDIGQLISQINSFENKK